MSATKPPSRVLIVLAVLTGIWLLAPMLIVVPMSLTDRRSLNFPPQGWSLQWYERFFTDEQWYGALLTSLEIAVLVMVVATIFGTAASFALVRGRFPGKNLVTDCCWRRSWSPW
jgi:putative spermidine/putrescine transport system permease protein